MLNRRYLGADPTKGSGDVNSNVVRNVLVAAVVVVVILLVVLVGCAVT